MCKNRTSYAIGKLDNAFGSKKQLSATNRKKASQATGLIDNAADATPRPRTNALPDIEVTPSCGAIKNAANELANAEVGTGNVGRKSNTATALSKDKLKNAKKSSPSLSKNQQKMQSQTVGSIFSGNTVQKNSKSSIETQLFLPDKHYQDLNKNIQNKYQSPNTKEVYKRLGNTSHKVEISIVISDEFGRIKYRIDYSTHGNNFAHTNPHIHEFVPNLYKDNDYPSEIKYFLYSNTGKMRKGIANNDKTYNWIDE